MARLVIEQIERSCIVRPDPCDVGSCNDRPPKQEELCQCAKDFCYCCRESRGAEVSTRDEAASGEGRERGTKASSADVRAQSRGPQQGASPAGSEEEEREQARGPQEGSKAAGSSERAREQAKGPQEGAK